jgi:hypothetical protein
MICAVIPVSQALSARIARFGGLIRRRTAQPQSGEIDRLDGRRLGPQVDGSDKAGFFLALGAMG